jgi:hypothetical protein
MLHILLNNSSGDKSMRAVVMGLVGAVLAVGAAAANETPMALAPSGCSLDRATLVIDGQPGTFSVTRYVSHRKPFTNPANGFTTLVGYDAAEITGAGGTYTIREEHLTGSTPITAWSAVGKSSEDIDWSKKGRPLKVEVGSEAFYINEGPLASKSSRVIACR